MDNSWQTQMYDRLFAEKTLDSSAMKEKARQETDFLVDVLGLPPHASILDVPCGTGRHSQLLAQKGFLVTGVDINPACVDLAKANGFTAHVGDMKDLSLYQGRFDCVLNLFSSFGYFSTDEENENVLKEMIKALKPGGKVVLNLINRNYLLSWYQNGFWVRQGNILLVQACKYDPQTHYNEAYITLKDEITGATTLSYHRMRLYAPEEIVEMMKRCGLKNVEVYGDFKRAPLDPEKSTHPFYIATRE